MDNKQGRAISERRIEKGLSQRELATMVDVSNSTIARIEKGSFEEPSCIILRKIAKLLDLDYNYLLALNNQIDDEPEIRIIQRAARYMNDADKSRMLQILQLSFPDAFGKAGGDS